MFSKARETYDAFQRLTSASSEGCDPERGLHRWRPYVGDPVPPEIFHRQTCYCGARVLLPCTCSCGNAHTRESALRPTEPQA